MWAILGTCPDLACHRCRWLIQHKPKPCNWELAKCYVCYLKGTCDWVLVYDGSDISMNMRFHGYMSTDWSSDNDTFCSMSCYVFITNKAATGWSSSSPQRASISHLQIQDSTLHSYALCLTS